MSDLDAARPDESDSRGTVLELHDSVIVGVEREGEDVRLRIEWVYVYSGEMLVRQEGGRLLLAGLRDCRVDGEPADLELQLEDGEVLSWSLERGNGSFVIQWCAYAPARQCVATWTFRYGACRWFPEFVHGDPPPGTR